MSSQPPLSCDLSAMGCEERKRHRQVTAHVLRSVEEIRELPDGYSFRLPTETDTIQEAAAFISRERLCCPFFDFTLDVRRDHGPVWLSVTGGEGVKPYVAENVIAPLEEDRNEK